MKQIEDFPDYFIDENGEVWSNKFNKWRKLKPGLTKKGYLSFIFCKNGKQYTKRLHRIIAETFIPNVENHPFVRHLDDNKLNNSIQNLAWGTNQDNVDDRVKNEGYLNQPKGEKQHLSKLTEKQVLEIRQKYIPRKYTLKQLSKEYGISRPAIYQIINYKIWKHI